MSLLQNAPVAARRILRICLSIVAWPDAHRLARQSVQLALIIVRAVGRFSASTLASTVAKKKVIKASNLDGRAVCLFGAATAPPRGSPRTPPRSPGPRRPGSACTSPARCCWPPQGQRPRVVAAGLSPTVQWRSHAVQPAPGASGAPRPPAGRQPGRARWHRLPCLRDSRTRQELRSGSVTLGLFALSDLIWNCCFAIRPPFQLKSAVFIFA